MQDIIFSGVKPTGNLHLGNYFGALQQWAKMTHSSPATAYFCVVDLHAITVSQDPETLTRQTREIAAWYIAAGIDPEKSIIFRQSDVPAHSELAWLLTCNTPMGDLERMTQYKDKAAKQTEGVMAGLFIYPVLMAADVLLYGTTQVPVGEDQLQHLELARELARRFNKRFNKVFIEPKAVLPPAGARIMGLDDPTKKMSKSEASTYHAIALTDDPLLIKKKIQKAITDSGTEVRYGDDKPAWNNLLTIYQLCAGMTPAQVTEQMRDKSYADAKALIADAVATHLQPIQDRYTALMSDMGLIDALLAKNARRAREVANETLARAKDAMGLK
jgi:tryptophanyl-tRNA synthetase